MNSEIASSPRSILVVDDTPANLQLLSDMLKEKGYKIRPAPNGELALRAARITPPDLVLLDITLPSMNGLDLLAWIRQHPDFSTLKVFVWTDSGDPAVLERALKAGANRFVPKSASFVRGGLAGLVRGISKAILNPAEKQTAPGKNS